MTSPATSLRRIASLALLLSAFVVSAGAKAADSDKGDAKAEGNTLAGTTARMRLSLLAPPAGIELPGEYRIVFRLSNLSAEKYHLKEFKIYSFNSIVGFVDDNACEVKGVIIPPHEELLVPCRIGGDWSVQRFGWSLLTLQPGTYSAHVAAKLAETDDGDYGAPIAVSTLFELQVRPSVWQVVMGAAVGSLLLALFVRLSPRPALRLLDRKRGRAGSLVSFFLFWLSAFIASAMFILLTYRLRETGSPFTITVNDFYGGIAIGMFGLLLADWLGRRLFGANEDTEVVAGADSKKDDSSSRELATSSESASIQSRALVAQLSYPPVAQSAEGTGPGRSEPS